MSAFVPILAALQLAVPVHCYQSEDAWQGEKLRARVHPATVAFYSPGVKDQPRIALSPTECKHVLAPNLEGADTLAHELAHHWQWVNGRDMNENEAVRIARWARAGLLRRLEQVLGRKAKPGPNPDSVVIVGGTP